MSAQRYNTNLAAEFYVLSMLHRLGVDASLTLGNKKSVDIAVVRGAGDAITIDVKGLAGTTAWPVDNVPFQNVPTTGPRHFIVFVSFLDRIGDPRASPEVWAVPLEELEPLVYCAPGGRQVVRFRTLTVQGEKFKDAWNLLT